ncbi:type IV pilus biogenesis/stability protein PilW [Pasteurella atlantica]|uniref:Type IV pilus biogenesis/stability protein PilW n=1 Tax=Pasteurella atlantica TaxID=2827233 RepID=A0AAW8CQK0_9PAST|nr:type IV pilus biogenesis/stability protein PilW [Pasteurella atlantica]MBR0574311.1 type IV pilus biogenesis/stability protein PilW [Pasteurella atlantica]MDP8032975.1 type IV pilus biogenesis/stability protein PilW [Pasteurella atlantica]MDP8034868.1 type IV pilus biogenesis/stability protein PilW [Pasteurella atlantica]MDP8036862.1 type IV pilus biogenesis/stability protein PilW [Pasteurella atlantica]MDP8040215.1 type IV pilus biogenesis/stability protein PilW [Pasteurella atlantica]
MKIANFYSNLTACIIALTLTGCVSTSTEHSINKTEAMQARLNLALAYLKENNFPKAKLNIDKALEHNNQHYLPYSVLAYYYQQTGKVSDASQTYQQAVTLSQKFTKDHQPRPDILNNYGTFLCKQAQFKQAYNLFEQALTSKQSYYHQADTLENIILCAKGEKNHTQMNNALIQLRKIDKERAEKISSM